MRPLSCFEKTLLRFRGSKPFALTSEHRGGVVFSERTARPAALRLEPSAGAAAACCRASRDASYVALLDLTLRTPNAKHACRGQKETRISSINNLQPRAITIAPKHNGHSKVRSPEISDRSHGKSLSFLYSA